MYKILILPVAAIILGACSGKPGKNEIPGKPASVNAVQTGIKGKKFKADRVGTHSVFANDPSIEWLQPAKENKFENEIVDESKTFQLDFMNDTALTMKFKDKTYDATYVVNDAEFENEKAGIKLRISYIDEEFKFGDGPASKITATYLVEGINQNSLLLETPRSMNRRNIVLLMTKQ